MCRYQLVVAVGLFALWSLFSRPVCAQTATSRKDQIALEHDTSALNEGISHLQDLLLSAPDSAIVTLQSQWSRTDPAARRNIAFDFYRARAEARFNKQDMAGARQDCDSALLHCRVARRDLDVAWVNVLLGRLLAWSGDYEQAARLLNGALTVFERNAAHERAIECLNHLGRVHFDQEQWALAKRRWKAMLELARRVGDQAAVADALRLVGLAELYLVEPSVGLAYYDSALNAARALKNPRLLARIHSNVGEHMDSALFFARASGDRALLHQILHTAGVIALRKGDFARGMVCCEQSLAFARGNGNQLLERDALQCLCDAYQASSNWRKAFQMMEEWNRLESRMISSRSRDEIAMLAIQGDMRAREFEDSLRHAAAMERVEQEKIVEQLRADSNRNSAIALGAGALALLGGGVVLFRVDRKRRRDRYERDAARLQTQVLRTQMNPHFIFNALNSINNYVQENERDLASGFLSKFARLMRLVLENSRHNEVPLVQDLEALRLYMELEQSRMNGKFDYSIEVDSAIDQAETMVPPLVLQPFVENAIWHGISRKEGKGHIKLIVRKYPDRLTMSVEDDGIGRGSSSTHLPPDGASPKASLGTTITQDRLSLLAKQRGGEAGFRFMDLEQGTRVEVELPI